DILVGLLAGLAFRKPGHGDRDAIGDPVAYAAGRPAFRIEHQQSIALGAFGRIGPGKLRRNVLTDAVRILLVVAGHLGGQTLAVLERGRGDRERFLSLSVCALAAAERYQRNAASQQQTSFYQHHGSPFWAVRPARGSVAGPAGKA